MSTTTLRLCAMALLLPLAACVNMSGLSGGSKYACTAPEACRAIADFAAAFWESRNEAPASCSPVAEAETVPRCR